MSGRRRNEKLLLEGKDAGDNTVLLADEVDKLAEWPARVFEESADLSELAIML